MAKPGRRYYMSAFHESPSNMRAYYDVIRENRFPWISGYPSLMVLLAQWMNERGLSFDFVKAVTCGAENLVEHQIDAMERAFGVRPVQTYGQTENVAIFSQAPDGKILVDEDFSVVEWHPEARGGSALWALACSTMRPRFCATTRATSCSWVTKRARAGRSPLLTVVARTMSICRMARRSGSSTTFSRTRRTSRRLKSTKLRITPCGFASWGSLVYA